MFSKRPCRTGGHEVVSTTNGLDAWQIMQSEGAPRHAILDWMMPRMEGPEICRKLREQQSVNPPYIILLTARTGVEQLVAGMRAGADDYLTKPYSRDELQVRLQVGIRMLDLQTTLANRVCELEEALERVKRLEGIIRSADIVREFERTVITGKIWRLTSRNIQQPNSVTAFVQLVTRWKSSIN